MIRNYLLVAWKVLLRRKFFTFVSLFGITFTIVVLLVVTALLDHIFAPHYPESNLSRTLGVYAVVQQGDQSKRTGFAGYTLLDRALRPLENVEETSIIQGQNKVASYQDDGRKLELFIKRTDDAFWRIMTFDFLEGGPFSASDYEQARPVAVINQSTAAEMFGERSALGQSIDVDNQRFRVVGVVRDVPFLRVLPYADVWVPLTTNRGEQWRHGLSGSMFGVVLAHDRSDFPRLKREFAGRVAQLPIPEKQFKTVRAELRTLFEFLALDLFQIGDTTRLRIVIAVLALMFMGLPAINLINLNLSRIMERLSEIGVRKAFGATSPTLIGQFLVENVVLTLVGGAAGLLFAGLVLSALNRSEFIPSAAFALNFRIFGWGLLLTLVFAVVSGIYPAWRMSRLHPIEALKGDSR